MVRTTERKTADEILAIVDTKTDEVWIEDWQTNVKVVGLTKQQQLDIRNASLVDGEVDADKSQAGMWLQGVLEPKFTEDQVALVFQKNAGAVDKVLTRILELSGMKEEDIKKRSDEFRKRQ